LSFSKAANILQTDFVVSSGILVKMDTS